MFEDSDGVNRPRPMCFLVIIIKYVDKSVYAVSDVFMTIPYTQNSSLRLSKS